MGGWVDWLLRKGILKRMRLWSGVSQNEATSVWQKLLYGACCAPNYVLLLKNRDPPFFSSLLPFMHTFLSSSKFVNVTKTYLPIVLSAKSIWKEESRRKLLGFLSSVRNLPFFTIFFSLYVAVNRDRRKKWVLQSAVFSVILVPVCNQK